MDKRAAFRRRMTEQYQAFAALPEEKRNEVEDRLLRQAADQYGEHQEARARRYQGMVQDHIREAMKDDI